MTLCFIWCSPLLLLTSPALSPKVSLLETASPRLCAVFVQRFQKEAIMNEAIRGNVSDEKFERLVHQSLL